jgi:tetratricopeptide (TPR) repeat protein
VTAYVQPQHDAVVKNAMAAVTKGNELYDKGDANEAQAQYKQAAHALLRSPLSRHRNAGRIAGTVAQLGYYFAVTGDNADAHKMWRLFTDYASDDSNDDVVEAARLRHFTEAFYLMLEHDSNVIASVNRWGASGEANVLRDALTTAARRNYRGAERLFRIAINCTMPDAGYALYGLGLTYLAMGDRVRARYAWLASSTSTGFGLPEMDVMAPSNARAMRMLLTFD